jgi:hypothetical protein
MSGLSERTRKFVMEITTNGTAPEDAAKIAGLPVSAVPAMMNNPIIKREIDTALEAQGVDDTYFASKLRQLCDACNPKGQPDWGARAKGLAMLKEIKGHEAPKKVEQTNTTITYEERLLMIADDSGQGVQKIREITCSQ